MIPDFPHNIRIRLARLKFFFCCILTQHFFLIRPILSYIMRKVWYHQIWIQNYLGIIVSDLIDILRLRQLQNISTPDFWTTNFHPDTKWILYSLVQLVEMLYIKINFLVHTIISILKNFFIELITKEMGSTKVP